MVCGPVDCNLFLKTAAFFGEELTGQKGLAWEIDLPAKLPVIQGDQTRLLQVILNLINNAVKFTREGKVTLKAENRDQELVITVSDTGLGIKPEDQGYLFDEFWQADRTLKHGSGGLGLGLAISRRLVELHGGKILGRVVRERFWFRFQL